MKTLIAMLKKEWMEQVRSSRLMILGLVFLAVGIMNPALAKITPWLMEMMAESLKESGLMVTEVNVDAMTSWTQFYKNIPMALIAFVLMQSSIFTKEYQSGTLILALTKGLERYKVLVAKTIMLGGLWTIYYWLCYVVTYAYNAYFWNNSIAKDLAFAALFWWIFGLWIVMLMVLFSVLGSNNTSVLLGTGGVAFGAYMVSMIPKVTDYLPTKLMDGMSLLMGLAEPDAYTKAIIITIVSAVVFFVISIPVMNKRQM